MPSGKRDGLAVWQAMMPEYGEADPRRRFSVCSEIATYRPVDGAFVCLTGPN